MIQNKVKLTNGLILTKMLDGHAYEKGRFPALQNVAKIDHACSVCPIRKYCGDNNEFDCQVYEMFSGFYLEDAFVDDFKSRWAVDEALQREGAFVP